jgi:alanyl-tRNA synthetase
MPRAVVVFSATGATIAEMTERLYYHDSYLKEFDATVVSCDRVGGREGDGASEAAERWRVVLDRTAFYPTSGGQPHDLGTLGGASVVEVADADAGGHVVHYTAADVPAGPVRGRVDWARRFDHMQQHTAQHLLSAAFIELFKLQTVSFHLGEEICTIDLIKGDLKAASVTQAQLDEAERRTNAIIFEDRVVEIRFGTAEELAAEGVRKSVERQGVLRAIRVEGFDFQPCGGTHLARTGQAGVVLIRGIERRRDAVRVEFVAGGRALATARRDFATLSEAATILTCGMPEVPAGVAKLNEERRDRQSALKKVEDRLADLEAAKLIAEKSAPGAGAARIVTSTIDDGSPSYLALLAAKTVARGDTYAPVIAVLAGSGGHVTLAQTKGGPHHMGIALRSVLGRFPGKGGGAKDFAQATLAAPAQAPDFLAEAARAVADSH